MTATRLRLRLDRALDGLNSRRVIQQLDAALARKSQDLHELNNIGVALSAQRDHRAEGTVVDGRGGFEWKGWLPNKDHPHAILRSGVLNNWNNSTRP